MANAKSDSSFYMKVDSKGRPTIPSEVRKEMGIEGGGTLCGKLVDGKLLMVVPDDPFDQLALNAQKELREGEGRIVREPGE